MNKYNARRETFTSIPILNGLLSDYATPPADFQLTPVDFDVQYLYSTGGSGGTSPCVKFAINDVPRILGVGLFCNLADGLVYIDNPDDFSRGPSISLQLNQFDSDDVDQGAVPSENAQVFRMPELNQIWDVDYLFNVTGVDTTLDSLRIQCNFSMNSMDFSTISINPDFATKRLIFRPVVIIEHTFPCTAESGD